MAEFPWKLSSSFGTTIIRREIWTVKRIYSYILYVFRVFFRFSNAICLTGVIFICDASQGLSEERRETHSCPKLKTSTPLMRHLKYALLWMGKMRYWICACTFFCAYEIRFIKRECKLNFSNIWISIYKCVFAHFPSILAFVCARIEFMKIYVSDEFCEEFPHNLIPTPGYWIECSRQKITTDTIWDESESEHESGRENDTPRRDRGDFYFYMSSSYRCREYWIKF